jgi:hypothetical protein
MAVRNSCPDCDPLDVSGLSHKSLRSPALTRAPVRS